MAEEVSKQEFLQMAGRCRDEIKELRGVIDHLRPKAEAYEAICAILGLLPQRSQGMSEDLVWRLNKRIDELTRVDEPEEVAA